MIQAFKWVVWVRIDCQPDVQNILLGGDDRSVFKTISSSPLPKRIRSKSNNFRSHRRIKMNANRQKLQEDGCKLKGHFHYSWKHREHNTQLQKFCISPTTYLRAEQHVVAFLSTLCTSTTSYWCSPSLSNKPSDEWQVGNNYLSLPRTEIVSHTWKNSSFITVSLRTTEIHRLNFFYHLEL